MIAKLLLDTHILLRYLHSPKKLTRDQVKVIDSAAARNEPFCIAASTLLEIIGSGLVPVIT